MKHRSIVPAALGICFQTWYKIKKIFWECWFDVLIIVRLVRDVKYIKLVRFSSFNGFIWMRTVSCFCTYIVTIIAKTPVTYQKQSCCL